MYLKLILNAQLPLFLLLHSKIIIHYQEFLFEIIINITKFVAFIDNLEQDNYN